MRCYLTNLLAPEIFLRNDNFIPLEQMTNRISIGSHASSNAIVADGVCDSVRGENCHTAPFDCPCSPPLSVCNPAGLCNCRDPPVMTNVLVGAQVFSSDAAALLPESCEMPAYDCNDYAANRKGLFFAFEVPHAGRTFVTTNLDENAGADTVRCSHFLLNHDTAPF